MTPWSESSHSPGLETGAIPHAQGLGVVPSETHFHWMLELFPEDEPNRTGPELLAELRSRGARRLEAVTLKANRRRIWSLTANGSRFNLHRAFARLLKKEGFSERSTVPPYYSLWTARFRSPRG